MSLLPKISICVPTYDKPEFVERLLISVLNQDHKNVEVIISDDSSNSDIKRVFEEYEGKISVRYYYHQPPLKTPRNWNYALDMAQGDYVMLVHQDDWFYAPTSLSTYIKAFESHDDIDFVFSRNTAVTEDGREIVLQGIPSLLRTLKKRYNHLLRFNVIGPPSNTMLRKGINIRYDENFMWLVDVDYYVRLLAHNYKPCYLDEHLVNIGLHEEQATNFCQKNTSIIVRENILYAAKLKPGVFRDIYIYDYYWRFLRNYQIRNEADIVVTGVSEDKIPSVINNMLKWQQKIPLSILKLGIFSKTLMLTNYLLEGRKYYSQ